MAVLYPHRHLPRHRVHVAAQQDAGLARAFSRNDVADVVDVDLFKAELVDALGPYHVGKGGL